MHLLQSTRSNSAIHEALADWARTNIAFVTCFKALSSKDSRLDLEEYRPGHLLREIRAARQEIRRDGLRTIRLNLCQESRKDIS